MWTSYDVRRIQLASLNPGLKLDGMKNAYSESDGTFEAAGAES